VRILLRTPFREESGVFWSLPATIREEIPMTLLPVAPAAPEPRKQVLSERLSDNLQDKGGFPVIS